MENELYHSGVAHYKNSAINDLKKALNLEGTDKVDKKLRSSVLKSRLCHSGTPQTPDGRGSGRYRKNWNELDGPSKDIDVSSHKYKSIVEKVEKSIDEETVSKYRALMDYNWELSEKISKMHSPSKDLLGKLSFSAKVMEAVPAKHIDNALIGLNGKDTYYVKESNTRANAYHVTADAFNSAAEKLSGEASSKYAKEIRDFIDKNHGAKLPEYFYLGASVDLSDTPFGKKLKHSADELYHYGIPQTPDGKGSGRYRKDWTLSRAKKSKVRTSLNRRKSKYGNLPEDQLSEETEAAPVKKSKLKKSVDFLNKAAKDYKERRRAKDIQKGKIDVKKLSDEELKSALDRLSNEEKYLKLVGKKTPEEKLKEKNAIIADLKKSAWQDFVLPMAKGQAAYMYQKALTNKMKDVDLEQKIGDAEAYAALRKMFGDNINPSRKQGVKRAVGERSKVYSDIKRAESSHDLKTDKGLKSFMDDIGIFTKKGTSLYTNIKNIVDSDKEYASTGQLSFDSWGKIAEVIGEETDIYSKIEEAWASPRERKFTDNEVKWKTVFMKK